MFSRVLLLSVALLYCEFKALVNREIDVVFVCMIALIMSSFMGDHDGKIR